MQINRGWRVDMAWIMLMLIVMIDTIEYKKTLDKVGRAYYVPYRINNNSKTGNCRLCN